LGRQYRGTSARCLVLSLLRLSGSVRIDEFGHAHLLRLQRACPHEHRGGDNAGANPLIANRTAIGGWETFQLLHNGDGSISLRAGANGKYVTAESAGAAALIANRTAIGPWEEFDLIAD